jgi:GTP:adenosylcobinamide-phosphate guanylyltransferase
VEDVNAAQEYWFMNVNTPEELKMARRRFEQSASSAAAGREVPGAS